ncbi:hypothetical protein [Actinomadura alba]|uniref:Lipoprotein n=1 Tax=Actinomadura alba TaxID=406431 RepID=A0ABR7LTY1_9ACTN|nr:hypothetical protein [Actinomadura alba]MBC6468206.1 hypothetical protein [Actinomadura alba]
MRTAARACIAGLMMLPVIAGCSERDPTDAIDDEGRRTVEDVIAEMQRAGYEFSTSVNFAREVEQRLEMHRPDTVDVLETAGDPLKDRGTVTVRISLTASYGRMFASTQITAGRCYRFTFERYRHTLEYRKVICSGGPALVLPKRTPAPELPDDAERKLEAALDRLRGADRRDAAAVRAAAERSVRGPGLMHEVAVGNGWIGVTVSAGRYECLMARVSAKDVEAWRPPRVYLQEGEMGCSVEAAAAGLVQRPPH